MRDIPMERPVGSCVGLMLREGSRIEREIWNHPYLMVPQAIQARGRRQGRFTPMRHDKIIQFLASETESQNEVWVQVC